MRLVCLDLEGVLLPEIWINIAKRTKIKELELTTRDVPDYDFLMKKRLKILEENGIKIKDIQKIIKEIKPLKGALNFLNWLRKRFPVIILSDTFYEFINPLVNKFSLPTIFCNKLEVDKEGFIKNYRLRQEDGKRKSVEILKKLGFEVVAIGDSYNDLEMLGKADFGILFKPPKKIIEKLPKFPTAKNYSELKSKLKSFIVKL